MRHKFIAKRYWENKKTAMGESDVLAKEFDDVINLSLGDPDLITDNYIIDNAFKDAKLGHTKYTDFSGDPELKEAIRELYKEDYNQEINLEEIFVCASACLGMYLALEAIIDDGDEVIIHAPYFTPYPQQIELARGIPVVLDTYEDEDYQINSSRLEGLLTEKTKAIIINTPNNPSGNCFDLKTMKEIARIAEKYDLIVIADDIYGAFSYKDEFIPFMALEGMRKRTITINSFSKNYIMTGWRVGNIIAPDYLIETIQAINENVVFTAPSISQRAAIYAIKKRKEIQSYIVDEYKKRVFYTAERINEIPKLSVLQPKGTFYLFVNIKKTGLSSDKAAEVILKEAHVLVLPGNAFGECGEGYIRLACTVDIKILKEAMDRISRIEKFK